MPMSSFRTPWPRTRSNPASRFPILYCDWTSPRSARLAVPVPTLADQMCGLAAIAWDASTQMATAVVQGVSTPICAVPAAGSLQAETPTSASLASQTAEKNGRYPIDAPLSRSGARMAKWSEEHDLRPTLLRHEGGPGNEDWRPRVARIPFQIGHAPGERVDRWIRQRRRRAEAVTDARPLPGARRETTARTPGTDIRE